MNEQLARQTFTSIAEGVTAAFKQSIASPEEGSFVEKATAIIQDGLESIADLETRIHVQERLLERYDQIANILSGESPAP